jgi:hypothetical protein
MAVKKKPTTKAKKADPKKTKTKPSLDLSRVQKNIVAGYKKRKVVYTSILIIILIVAGTFSLFWFNKSVFLAGTINGKVVTSPEFYSKLTKASGEEVFDSIVREVLIKQEASDQDITASEEEVDEKIKELEDQLGGKDNLELALKQNKTSIDEVREQIAIQILVEKLLEDQIEVTDKEIANYIKENKQVSPNLTKEEAREAIKSSKLNEKFTTWFEELKNNATIETYF